MLRRRSTGSKSVLDTINSALDNLKENERKLRLRILKRISAPQLSHIKKPGHDEVKSWADSFDNLMNSKYGQNVFMTHLQGEFSEENLEFWIAVEDYRNSKPSELETNAKNIYDDFVAVKSEREINLDCGTKSKIKLDLSNANKTIFDVAQKRARSLMEFEVFQRFLRSQLYKDQLSSELICC